MKKFLFALSMGFTSVVALGTCVYSQNSVSPVAFNDAKKFKSSIRHMADLVSPAYMTDNVPDDKNIHVRALKDFQDRFNDASNVRWFSDGNSFTSYFNKDGYFDRAVYNKNGRWQFSMIYYAEDKLPESVRAAVKSVYFDWKIIIVQEVRTNFGMVYIINMEDNSNLKVLKVNSRGEMETMLTLTKY